MEQFGLGGVSLDSLNKHKASTPTLNEEQMARYLAAVKDMTTNESYGRLAIAQVPENSTFSTIRSICNRWNQRFQVDVIIIDSIDLIGSDRRRREKRDELNEVIMAAKGLAMSFDEGRGAPVISPWQISRDGSKRANDPQHGTGTYDLPSLGETSEIERKADCIFSMIEKKDASNRLTVDVLKWRDGRKASFEFVTDLDQSYIGSNESLSRENTDLLDLVA
jgi:replicative DNA helicase